MTKFSPLNKTFLPPETQRTLQTELLSTDWSSGGGTVIVFYCVPMKNPPGSNELFQTHGHTYDPVKFRLSQTKQSRGWGWDLRGVVNRDVWEVREDGARGIRMHSVHVWNYQRKNANLESLIDF